MKCRASLSSYKFRDLKRPFITPSSALSVAGSETCFGNFSGANIYFQGGSEHFHENEDFCFCCTPRFGSWISSCCKELFKVFKKVRKLSHFHTIKGGTPLLCWMGKALRMGWFGFLWRGLGMGGSSPLRLGLGVKRRSRRGRRRLGLGSPKSDGDSQAYLQGA